jgi:hypothetical protein
MLACQHAVFTSWLADRREWQSVLLPEQRPATACCYFSFTGLHLLLGMCSSGLNMRLAGHAGHVLAVGQLQVCASSITSLCVAYCIAM